MWKFSMTAKPEADSEIVSEEYDALVWGWSPPPPRWGSRFTGRGCRAPFWEAWGKSWIVLLIWPLTVLAFLHINATNMRKSVGLLQLQTSVDASPSSSPFVSAPYLLKKTFKLIGFCRKHILMKLFQTSNIGIVKCCQSHFCFDLTTVA